MTSSEPRSYAVVSSQALHLRHMAVMFVDLDHFMRMCTDVSPQAVFALLREFQHIVTDTVSSFGGELNSYQGDGVLAVFEGFAGRANCATRALRCAGKILEQIDALNFDQAFSDDQSVSASVGLQYGQVWSGTIGISKRFGPMLIGDAVNVAVRLEGQARALATSIVVGDDLIQLARREHGAGAAELKRFVDAGPVLIRGHRTPVKVWAHQPKAAELLVQNALTAPVCASSPLHVDD
jgi:adenylate cyclase